VPCSGHCSTHCCRWTTELGTPKKNQLRARKERACEWAEGSLNMAQWLLDKRVIHYKSVPENMQCKAFEARFVCKIEWLVETYRCVNNVWMHQLHRPPADINKTFTTYTWITTELHIDINAELAIKNCHCVCSVVHTAYTMTVFNG